MGVTVDGGGAVPGMDLAGEGLHDGAKVGHGDNGGLLNIIDGHVGGLWHNSHHRRRSLYCLEKVAGGGDRLRVKAAAFGCGRRLQAWRIH